MSVETDIMRYYAGLDREAARESWRESREDDALDAVCEDADVVQRYLERGELPTELLLDALNAYRPSADAMRKALDALYADVKRYVLEQEQDAIAAHLDAMEEAAIEAAALTRAGY